MTEVDNLCDLEYLYTLNGTFMERKLKISSRLVWLVVFRWNDINEDIFSVINWFHLIDCVVTHTDSDFQHFVFRFLRKLKELSGHRKSTLHSNVEKVRNISTNLVNSLMYGDVHVGYPYILSEPSSIAF